jgi:hypothetical protein
VFEIEDKMTFIKNTIFPFDNLFVGKARERENRKIIHKNYFLANILAF